MRDDYQVRLLRIALGGFFLFNIFSSSSYAAKKPIVNSKHFSHRQQGDVTSEFKSLSISDGYDADSDDAELLRYSSEDLALKRLVRKRCKIFFLVLKDNDKIYCSNFFKNSKGYKKNKKLFLTTLFSQLLRQTDPFDFITLLFRLINCPNFLNDVEKCSQDQHIQIFLKSIFFKIAGYLVGNQINTKKQIVEEWGKKIIISFCEHQKLASYLKTTVFQQNDIFASLAPEPTGGQSEHMKNSCVIL